MSIKDEMAAMTAGLSAPPTITSKRAASSGTAPGAMLGLNAGFRNLQAENEQLKKEAERAARVPLALCDDGHLHAGPVDSERVAELKANISENGQSSPAVVRRKGDGRFEIVIGRHRKAAMLGLGMAEWDVVVREMDDDQAERLSFYDNLWAPNITDYVKFRGLKRRLDRKGLTQEQLAREAGMGESTVRALLSFGKLPEDALAIVERDPVNFGMNMVQKLAGLVDQHAALVTRVIDDVAAGRLQQKDAPAEVLKLANSQGTPAKDSSAGRGRGRGGLIPVEYGGNQFATVEVGVRTLTVKLANKTEMEAVQKAVLKMLEARAKAAGPASA